MYFFHLLKQTGLFAFIFCLSFWPYSGQAATDMPDIMKYAATPAPRLQNHTAVSGEPAEVTDVHGERVNIIKDAELHSGLVFAGGENGVVLMQGQKPDPLNPQYINAREIKLKARELADQLIAGVNNDQLKGLIALPVAFVHLDNFEKSSSFGRLMAEQLIYEFNQRGFPVKEYRASGRISVTAEGDERFLHRKKSDYAVTQCGVVVTGTYYHDKNAVIVNARLIRPRDGRVLRTANLVLQNNAFTKQLLAQGSGGGALAAGTMKIRCGNPPIDPVRATPFDRGEDIH